MSTITPGGSILTTQAPTPDEARLRRVSGELEGVFVNELFKAMRETVPEGGMVDGGTGEEIFSSMMDQHLSGAVASGWERGLGAALYRQLRQLVPATETEAQPPVAASAAE